MLSNKLFEALTQLGVKYRVFSDILVVKEGQETEFGSGLVGIEIIHPESLEVAEAVIIQFVPHAM